MKSLRLNLPFVLVNLIAIGVLLAAALHLTPIETDIIRFLPQNEPMLADAGTIFEHHPMQGQMAIDLGVTTADAERLVAAGQWLEQRMQESDLFKSVGMDAMQSLMPDLLRHIVDTLPVLFTSEALTAQVLPLLAPEKVSARMRALQEQLLGLEAIGQTEFIAPDPLALRNIVMAQLAHLAPTRAIEMHKGRLLSADRTHLLIVATPAAAGTDTAFAARLSAFMHAQETELAERFGGPDPVVMTPMGAYRAALDNERIARKDVQTAIVLSTLGIALLLVFAFPRPLIGLFAFLPAAAGTVVAFFILALLHESISIMALGFGGAIISITVDHGIAYLLFLDQSQTTHGKAASREIRAIGLIAALTTTGAFCALNLTGFPVLAQLGQFAAIGIATTFLYVHFIFPKIFPQLPPARPRFLPLRYALDKLPVAGKGTALMLLAFMGVMLFFAKPVFNADLRSMNTVSTQTAAAEALMTRVWGGAIFDKLFLMTEAESPGQLRRQADRVLDRFSADVRAGRMAESFLPSMIFPGPERAAANFAAWQVFWTPDRTDALGRALSQAAEDLGFRPEAFEPFMRMVRAPVPPLLGPIPDEFYPLMGIAQRGDGVWMQFATLTPGPAYDPLQFQEHYRPLAKPFDPSYFSERLGSLLFKTFVRMLAIIGGSVALIIFFFFLDLKLTAITLAPVLFALISTLGTFHLIGHPLDIPALMLGIIVMGMGIDYSLYLVCAYQRYGGMDTPDFARIKMAVTMAAGSTLIGFGVLCLAEHALLYSAGVTSSLGISFSLIGAFGLLPPLLEHHFRRPSRNDENSLDLHQRILNRYRHLTVHPRLFARIKLKKDVLFAELPLFLERDRSLATVLDIGCGYGVPGCWILETHPETRLHAIEPDPERVRVAGLAFDGRGEVVCDLAPNIPAAPQPADAALLLDMIHFLDEESLRTTLTRLHAALSPGALLVIRTVVPAPEGRRSLHWRIDALRMRLAGFRAYHRPADKVAAIIAAAGFRITKQAGSGNNPELAWLTATRP